MQQIIQAISSGGGTRITIRYYPAVSGGLEYHYSAFKQVVTEAERIFVIFTFDCEPTFTERELIGNIKNDLEKFVGTGMTVSNGAISIKNDGTTMKLINSGASENVRQQGTFTFYDGDIVD